ncbi:MAG: hypothetical protein GY754_33445 [bacterium]|nr:hypothetical protein [bacterium]
MNNSIFYFCFKIDVYFPNIIGNEQQEKGMNDRRQGQGTRDKVKPPTGRFIRRRDVACNVFTYWVHGEERRPGWVGFRLFLLTDP